MPVLWINTNLAFDGSSRRELLSECSKAVATVLGKAESCVMVGVNERVSMIFGGSDAASAYGELVSIGSINPDTNARLTKALANVLQKFSIPPSRFYIKFYDVKASNLGWNGGTY